MTSPPPAHNFDEIPEVHEVDDFWHKKYAEDEQGHLSPVVAGGADPAEDPAEDPAADPAADPPGAHGAHTGIHLPSPSFYPVLTSISFPLLAWGLIYSPALLVVGAAILLGGLYGWALEPSAE